MLLVPVLMPIIVACIANFHLYALAILELSRAGYSIASRGHMVVPASHFRLDPLVCFLVSYFHI